MNQLTSRQRKLIYLGGIIVLMIPVIVLGRPSAPPSRAEPEGDAGGVLSRLRKQHDLGETDLGAVDPSSAAMNLVLLGFRGLAANVLHQRAEYYKDRKDWAQMEVNTESIVRLQPHYLGVWQYYGHNLAFNVSSEFDDVRDRYHWVKRGTKFQIRGAQQNERHPELYWQIGNLFGKKIGRSDEWRQFRRYFLNDPDPLSRADPEMPGPDKELNPEGRDNYLVSKDWFQKANDRVIPGSPFRQHIMAEILFKSYPARAQFDYAEVRHREGRFDEETTRAWEQAYVDWTQNYGQMEFPIPATDRIIRLEWTRDDIRKVAQSEDEEFAYRSVLNQQQNMVNYRYWRMLALMERKRETTQAHYEMYSALQSLAKGNWSEGEKLAFSGMTKWEKVLDEFKDMTLQDDVIEQSLLAQLVWRECAKWNGTDLPQTFPLQRIWNLYQDRLVLVQAELERRLSSLE